MLDRTCAMHVFMMGGFFLGIFQESIHIFIHIYSAFKKLGRRPFFSREIHARKDNSVATPELHVETK